MSEVSILPVPFGIYWIAGGEYRVWVCDEQGNSWTLKEALPAEKAIEVCGKVRERGFLNPELWDKGQKAGPER